MKTILSKDNRDDYLFRKRAPEVARTIAIRKLGLSEEKLQRYERAEARKGLASALSYVRLHNEKEACYALLEKIQAGKTIKQTMADMIENATGVEGVTVDTHYAENLWKTENDEWIAVRAIGRGRPYPSASKKATGNILLSVDAEYGGEPECRSIVQELKRMGLTQYADEVTCGSTTLLHRGSRWMRMKTK